MKIRGWQLGLGALLVVANLSVPVAAQRGGGAPPAPRAAAPIDLTGYWVAVVSEDWRYRMVTPPKGDFTSVPVNAEAVRVANAWDPAADEKDGNQCRSYGAAAIMRLPTRVHIIWVDDNTLRLETDAGMQERIFRFGGEAGAPAGEPSWQGRSVATWERPARGGGRGGGGPGGAAAPMTGSLKVITNNLRSGYLRKNGIPYSENAVVTEYFDVVKDGKGASWLVVTSAVDDPKYLAQPFILSSQFKKEADATKWDPTPCSSSW